MTKKFKGSGEAMARLQAYCDGSCPGARGFGGWAYVVVQETQAMPNLYGKGFKAETTNNEMEVMAAVELMKRLIEEGLGYEREPITIWSDSKYCVYGFDVWRHKWAFDDFKRMTNTPHAGSLEPIPNASIWREGHELAELFTDLKFKWVRGHNGNYWNERVDAMAGAAMKAGRRTVRV